MYEDDMHLTNLTYEEALVKVFHDLWTTVQSWSVQAGPVVQTHRQSLPPAEIGTAQH